MRGLFLREASCSSVIYSSTFPPVHLPHLVPPSVHDLAVPGPSLYVLIPSDPVPPPVHAPVPVPAIPGTSTYGGLSPHSVPPDYPPVQDPAVPGPSAYMPGLFADHLDPVYGSHNRTFESEASAPPTVPHSSDYRRML